MPAILEVRMISLLLWWEYRVRKDLRVNKVPRVRLAPPVRRDLRENKVCKVKLVPLVHKDRKANRASKARQALKVRRGLRESKVLRVWAFHRRLLSMALH